MPEGPEVKLMANFINNEVKGKYLQEIKILGGYYRTHQLEGLDSFEQKLPMKLKEVKTKGKFIYFIFIHNGKRIILGNSLGMEGVWTDIYNKHCDVELRFSNKILWFADWRKFGKFYVMTPEQLEEKLNKLGPDILSNISFNTFKTNLSKKPQQQITQALLDQYLISGIGNYLKSEILYDAKLNPQTNIGNLTEQQWESLYSSAKKITREAYLLGGSKFYAKKTNGILLGRYKFLVYTQKKDPNGNDICRDKFRDNRTTHWVPKIQK